MSLFNKKIKTFEQHTFSAKENNQIYEALREKKAYQEIKQELGWINTVSQVKLIKAEIKRLEKEILQKIQGTFTVDGEVQPKTTVKTNLLLSLSSDLIDVETLLNDCIAYNPSYDASRTWTAFKEYYNTSDI